MIGYVILIGVCMFCFDWGISFDSRCFNDYFEFYSICTFHVISSNFIMFGLLFFVILIQAGVCIANCLETLLSFCVCVGDKKGTANIYYKLNQIFTFCGIIYVTVWQFFFVWMVIVIDYFYKNKNSPNFHGDGIINDGQNFHFVLFCTLYVIINIGSYFLITNGTLFANVMDFISEILLLDCCRIQKQPEDIIKTTISPIQQDSIQRDQIQPNSSKHTTTNPSTEVFVMINIPQ